MPPHPQYTHPPHPAPHTPDPCARVCCDFRAEFPLGSDVEKRCAATDAAVADIAWLALTWLVFVLPHRDMCNTPGHTYMCTYAIQFSSVYFTARRSQHQLSLPCPALPCPPLPSSALPCQFTLVPPLELKRAHTPCTPCAHTHSLAHYFVCI